MNDIYENIGEKNRDKECKKMTLFDGMIADMLSIKKLSLLVNQLFIKGQNLKVSLVFIAQSYFAEPQNIRLNSTHYFIMKIPKKQELQQIVINLFDNIANQLSQFWTKNWAKINDSFEKFNINSQIKFKNSQTWQAQM